MADCYNWSPEAKLKKVYKYKITKMKDLKKSRIEHNQIKEALSNDIKTGLHYNFTLVNNDTGLTTAVKHMPIRTIIQLLKKFETPFKKNLIDGMKVTGSHKNGKTTDTKVTKL